MSGPQVLHSTGWGDEGRHWLTIASEPPLQVGPVARNHCRIGVAILRAAWDALDRLPRGKSVPQTVELRSGLKRVRVSLPLAPARWRGERDEPQEDPAETWFFTPLPHGPWKGGYDEWLASIAQQLGLDPRPAADANGYEREMQEARVALQEHLPGLRERFMRGLDGLNLGFKIGLQTTESGTEWCWISPTSWEDPALVVATLESDPQECPGFKSGQEMRVPVAELADYALGSPSQGLVEGGATSRIAEDYGLTL